ncbi:MAG: S8 family peptidase [Bacteroidetes bacterium]|nr:S8 family peptidase [Bacteroidota bacterium]
MKLLKSFWFILLFLPPSIVWSQDAAAIPNEFIVQLKSGHRVEGVLQSNSGLKIEKCLSGRMNIWLLGSHNSDSPTETLQRLRLHSDVQIAQFNHVVQQRSVVPDDTHFTEQWGMQNTGQSLGVVGADIEATEAWAINNDAVTAAGDTVVVAIIDGKFDLLHEDIDFFINYNEIPANNIDDDSNGYVDDVQGWNAYDDNGNVIGGTFSAQHGTHVSGIASAKGNNALGVAGACWGAKILPVSGSGSDEATVVIAYNYVREMRLMYDSTNGAKGAFVVATNSSFGVDEGNPANYPLWCAMYDSMGKAGILSAGATANDNANVDVVHDIPTECASNWLIAVTNTTRNDARNGGAAYGKLSVDLGAPGTGIYSTLPSNNYGNQTGTSMATPHVAGSIAAMYAAACPALISAYKEHPDSVALLIRQYLLESAEWISAMNNLTATNGRLNLYRALMSLRRFNCDSCNFDITLDKVDIVCRNANNGALSLGPIDNPAAYSYLWSTGHTTIEILNCAPGFYTLQVTDTATGCRRTTTTQLYNPDTLQIATINTIPAMNGNPGNITIVATAGNDTLSYSLDGVTYQDSKFFAIPSNGTYTVYVKSQRGCVVTQTVVVSSADDLLTELMNLQLYPNPAVNDLMITVQALPQVPCPVYFYNELGEMVYASKLDSYTQRINMANWSDGVYYVKVGNAVKKFVIIR